MNAPQNDFSLVCPIPLADYPTVLMAHGGGGKLMHQLIGKMFQPAIANPLLESSHDGAVVEFGAQRLAFTTDSYVVRPLFFPGGDIAHLAVNGTVNDLAMCGARPLYLSVGLILEEGLLMETLWKVMQSLGRAAEAAGITVVTGDTKVVDRGKGDQIFINTAGIGLVPAGVSVHPSQVRAGDTVLLNGDLARHGIAIMAVREGLEFEGTVESDCAPLARPVAALLDAGIKVHCMRDLTRGGLASALVEIAEAARFEIEIDESAVPVREEVRGACEILGFDPLYVANEGRFVAFVDGEDAGRALAILRQDPLCRDACAIGRVRALDNSAFATGLVTLKTRIGSTRIVDMLSGEQLPRIC